MNKLFTKIATAFVGIAMAIGVGVAVGNNSEFKAAHAATATMTSFSAVDGIVGGDTNVSYASYKGGGTSAPAINSSAIRLYQNAGDKTGGMLVVKTVSGCTISSITIRSSMATTVGIKIGTEYSGTDSINKTDVDSSKQVSADTDVAFGSISNSVVTMFCLGTSSSSRWYVNKLSVTYEGSSPTPTTYTVTYAANDGTSTTKADPNSPYSAGATVTVLANEFEREGYDFVDFNTSADGSGTSYDASDTFTINANTTLYAQWEEHIDGIKFDLTSNPGGWPTANETTLTDYDYNLDEVDYTFSLKNIKCNSGYLMCTSPAVLGLPAIVGKKLTKVVINNSSGCSTSTVVGISSSSSTFTKVTGGDNQTWSTTSSKYTYNLSGTQGNTQYYLFITNKNAQITYITLVYEDLPKCTVTFTVNTPGYGTVSEDSITNVPNGSTITSSNNTVTINGTTVTATPSSSTVQYNYSFDNWTNATGTVTSNITITANFSRTTRTYTILWKNYDGTVLETDNNVQYGATPSYNGTTPTRASTAEYSYSFSGWDPSPTSVVGDAIYTAQYNSTKNTYDVTGSISHGTLSVPGKIEYGGSLNVTIVADTDYGVPENKSDISATGATISTYTVTDETHGVVSLSDATGPVTVTASCIPLVDVFTVTYDPNDGTSPKTTEEVLENGHPTFPTPTRSGYSFKGWQVDGEGTAYTNPNDYTVTADVEFVAKWVAVYTVTFNSSGGSSSPESIPVEDGLTFTFPSPGTKAHHSFLGWSSDGGTTKYAAETTSPAVVDNITYIAQWSEDAFCTVTYSTVSHGTGSYAHTHQYLGTYTLLAFNLLDGVTAESGYQFKNYTVGGLSKDPGDTFTLEEATTIIVNFELAPSEETITKTMSQIVSENDFTVSSGTNVTCYTEFSLDELVTVSTTGTPNCGSFWGTSPNNDWRLYQNQSGNIIISVPTGCELEKITINYGVSNTGALFDGLTQITSGTEYNVSGTSVTYTVGNTGTATNGQVRITSILVTYVVTAPITTYTITYNGNGATGGSMNPTTGTAPKVAGCEFIKTDFDFERWNTQADGEGIDYEVGTTVLEDITLYAIWHEHVEPIGGNVTMEGITSTESVTVNTRPGIKCGASSTAGEMKLTLTQANMTKIKVYIAGWSGDTNNTINVSIDNGATISQGGSPVESIDVIQDDGIGGSGKSYTLEEEETTYKFVFDIANAPANTKITLTAAKSSKCRFVVWGATDLFAETFANEFMTKMTCHNGDIPPTFETGYSWAYFDSFYGSLDAEEQGRLQGAQASEAGSTIQQAMARYDYIEGRYNPDNLPTSAWKNFIGRTVTPIGNGRIMINLLTSQVTNTSIIVIVTVAVSAIAVGGYFFLRKKKED